MSLKVGMVSVMRPYAVFLYFLSTCSVGGCAAHSNYRVFEVADVNFCVNKELNIQLTESIETKEIDGATVEVVLDDFPEIRKVSVEVRDLIVRRGKVIFTSHLYAIPIPEKRGGGLISWDYGGGLYFTSNMPPAIHVRSTLLAESMTNYEYWAFCTHSFGPCLRTFNLAPDVAISYWIDKPPDNNWREADSVIIKGIREHLKVCD